jgi:glutaminase
MPTSRTESYGAPYVSTGHLPNQEVVRNLVAEAHERYKSHTEG